MRQAVFGLLLVAVSLPAAAQRAFDFKDYALTGIAAEIDAATDGALTLASAEAGFDGSKGKTLTLRGIKPYARIDLVGIGSEAVDRNAAENFGGTAAGLNDGKNGAPVQVLWSGIPRTDDATAARVAFGYQLGSYRFDRYKENKIDVAELPVVTLLTDDDSAGQFENDLGYLADSVYMARDFPSEPANIVWPQTFVDRVRDAFRGVDNVKIKVLDEKDLERLGMNAHLGVGKGSVRPPRLLIIEYMGGGDEAPIALAGKGITFDTGGISIKPNTNMWMMKGDLGGAGVVSGVTLAIAKRGEPVNLVTLVALAENMPSANAQRPGDVITSMSGKTIEIRSTDAEGRLVLSDAVHYAQVNYEPSILIDVATLTGSVGRALGEQYAGIFARPAHQELVDQLAAASKAANERVWQLPLENWHFKSIEAQYADVVNSGVSPGASTGAAFIGSFVNEEQPWVHFDIAGVDYYSKGTATVPMGYSGWGVRTLDEFIRRQAAK